MDIYKLNNEDLIGQVKLLKKELKSSEKNLKYLFESFEDIYFRSQLDGELVMVSPSVKRILSFEQEEMVGKNITNFYLYSMNTKSLLKELVKEREIRNIFISIVHRSGKIVPATCCLKLIKDKQWFVQGVIRNQSDVVHTKEELDKAIKIAERSIKVKEDFLANMSHEIRTPLNGILGMADMLATTTLDSNQQKQVAAIRDSSYILLNLLNNILDLSKLEAGKVGIRLNSVSPVKLLQKVIMLYEQKALDKGLKLSIDISDEIPEYIFTDEFKLIQIYSNLTSNAIKFTPEGGEVFLILTQEKRRNKHLLLKGEVIDTGIGIKEEDTSKLFSSFTQLDSSNSKKHEGAGLGLSISKEIVSLLGGEMGVKSKENKGSNFWFTFICEEGEKDTSEESKIYHHPKLETSPEILVVDDNNINLELASQILNRAGADVTTAGSGGEAIKFLQEKRFDIVLLDIQMPEVSGVEVMQWMKENLSSVPPTIALTAYSSDSEKNKFLSCGFHDFVAKPISPDVLTTKIKEWAEKQDQIIDRKVLEKLIQYGGEEIVTEALDEFCSETELQIKECFVSLSESNHKHILDLLHALKGNAGTLGVNRIARKARGIEEQLKKGYVSGLEEELKSLEYFFKEFKVHYKEH